MKPTTKALLTAFRNRRNVFGRTMVDDRRALASWQRESRERYGTPVIVGWLMQAKEVRVASS